MNLNGSYRALRNNAKAAMLAAIEIYNKPQIEYRDECFVILLVNAWELLLKAILAKNKQRLFYPKKREESYRSLSIQDALARVQNFFPTDIPYEPVVKNLELLVIYRNNAIHFYNHNRFSIVIYGLAQTSIINFSDLMRSIFNNDITMDMTISLLPLAFGPLPDPVEFLKKAKVDPPKNKAVAQFINEISQATADLEAQSFDTSRFLTVFSVKLQSIKKVSAADVVVGIASPASEADPLIIERRVDPNISHPLRRKEILEEIGPTLNGVKFTQHTFEAIAWHQGIKTKPHLCWRSNVGEITRYSQEMIAFLKKLTSSDIDAAITAYRQRQ